MLFSKPTPYAYLLFAVLFFSSEKSLAQIYNTEVEAKIYLNPNNEFTEITGTAFNKSQLSKSLRYVLSVFRTNPETSNKSKNEQSGRLVLTGGERVNLSKTTINSETSDRVILLLLLYDENDQIIGKDRMVINDDPANNDDDAISTAQIQSQPSEKLIASVDVDNSSKDGVVLSGIVLEETITKPGRDFYDLFYSDYILKEINATEIIKIKEVIAVGRNTRMEVYVGETLIFRFFARPQIDYLKTMTEAAMKRVNYHLRRQKNDSKTIKRY